MLQEQQLIANRAGFSLLDELPLQLERVGVGDEAQAPDVRWRSGAGVADTAQAQPSSKFSSRSLKKLRNRPASAPSTRRWS